MSTVTRNDFAQRFDGKSVNLSALNGLSSAQRTALRRADANGDGRLEGAAELRAAFNQVDNFDRNGSRTSVNAGTSARPSSAGAMINSMERAATTAAPRRGLSGNTQAAPSEQAAPRTTSGADGTARISRTTNAGARNQMVSGQVTVNGHTYDFRSGGFGKGSLPKGNYTVTRHMDSRNTRGMVVGGVGYSFALNNKFDSRVGATRTELRIHPDGGSAGTNGCIGIVGNAAVQRQFRADMLAEIRKNGGSYTLSVQ